MISSFIQAGTEILDLVTKSARIKSELGHPFGWFQWSEWLQNRRANSPRWVLSTTEDRLQKYFFQLEDLVPDLWENIIDKSLSNLHLNWHNSNEDYLGICQLCSPKSPLSRGPDLRAEKIFLQSVFSSRQHPPRIVSSPILKSIGPLEPSERTS